MVLIRAVRPYVDLSIYPNKVRSVMLSSSRTYVHTKVFLSIRVWVRGYFSTNGLLISAGLVPVAPLVFDDLYYLKEWVQR